MIDLPDIIEKHVRKDAQEQLKRLNIALARDMEREDFREYVNNLRRLADIKESERFSRERMDALHALHAQMRGE